MPITVKRARHLISALPAILYALTVFTPLSSCQKIDDAATKTEQDALFHAKKQEDRMLAPQESESPDPDSHDSGLACHTLSAGEHTEYESEFHLNSGSINELPAIVRVLTQDGKVQRISFRDRKNHPNRIEIFSFRDTEVIRYQIFSTVTGRPTSTHDLSRNTTLPQSECKRIIAMAMVLLRHFDHKGNYRQLPPQLPPQDAPP